jgi:hypothetical protein
MPNIRETFVATAGTVVYNAPDLSAPHEALLLDWLWAHYAPTDTTPGSPTFGQPLTRNNANEAQAFRNFAAAKWQGVQAQVRRWKLDQLRAAVPDPGNIGG